MKNFHFAIYFLLINTRVQKVNAGSFLFSSFRQPLLIKAETLLYLISLSNSSWEEKARKARTKSAMKTTPAPKTTALHSGYRKAPQDRGATENQTCRNLPPKTESGIYLNSGRIENISLSHFSQGTLHLYPGFQAKLDEGLLQEWAKPTDTSTAGTQLWIQENSRK